MINARVQAVRILLGVIIDKQSLTDALRKNLDPSDSGSSLIRELSSGVLRFYPRLDFVLQHLLNEPLPEKHTDLRLLLMVGCYQLLYLTIPDYAVLSETVNACVMLKKAWAKNMVTAVLRRLQREQNNLQAQIDLNEVAQSAHPAWLLTAIQADWPTHWPSIIEANNQRPPFVLRINQQKTNQSQYLAELTKHAISARSYPDFPTAIAVDHACNVTDLPGFASGDVSVQDAGAQLAAELLQLAPGLRVLDACAAPGGKSCHLLECQPDLAQLVCLDNNDSRLKRIAENLARLKLSAKIMLADSGDPATWWDTIPFDRILLDAPCSATGVIRRHPDIKWLRRADDIASLPQQQLRLLQALWPTLAPGGTLLYCTCSILRAENDDVIQQFLANQADATCCTLHHPASIATQYGLQFLPGLSLSDGFYYARLSKS